MQNNIHFPIFLERLLEVEKRITKNILRLAKVLAKELAKGELVCETFIMRKQLGYRNFGNVSFSH